MNLDCLIQKFESNQSIFEYKSREIIDRINVLTKNIFLKKTNILGYFYLLPDIKSCLLVRHP